MKDNNEFMSFLNSSIAFFPDYNELKRQINTNQFKNKKINNYNLYKFFKLSIYAIIICLISVFTTVIVKENINSGVSGDVSPGKEDIQFLEEQFDEFFAFGAGSPANLFTLDIIINSNLIDENSKGELLSYKNEYYKERNYEYFNIYLGKKDDKDIVYLFPLGEPNISFIFESKLDYKFKDIINEFEILCGDNLNKDFLYGKEFDNALRKETMGIILSFKRVDDKYIPYYTMELKDKVYVVDKS